MRPGERKNPRVLKRTPEHSALVRGLLLMTVAMLVIPAMDAVVKYISGSINGVQAGQARFGFQALFLVPAVLLLHGVRGLRPNNIPLNLARSCLMAFAVVLFFTALKWMPVADAIAVFFVEPLILTVLSGIFLGEKIGWPRRFAVIVGFIGALIVVRPSYEVFGWVSLLPLAAAFFFALYLMLTSMLSKSEDPFTMQFFSGLCGFIVLTLIALAGTAADIDVLKMNWPTPFEWLLLASVGLVAAVIHLMIVYAFRVAPASVLAPFNYLEIVSATALGYFVFGDFPDLLRWVGIAIIVSSGLFVFWRESRATTS